MRGVWRRWLSGLLLGLGWSWGQPAIAAERIELTLGPLVITVAVDSLATFAETGEAPQDLRAFTKRLSPEAQTQLRQWLQQKADINPVAVAQYTYTPIGELIFNNLGQAVQTAAGTNGFHALRAAAILSAASPNGLSILEFLRQYPTEAVRLDGELLLNLSKQAQVYFNYRNAAVAAIAAQAQTEAATQPPVDVAALRDLAEFGPYQVERQTFDFTTERAALGFLQDYADERFLVDVYLPQDVSEPMPLIVVGHGLGSDRRRIDWLLFHLASYGFVIIAPEHRGSNLERRRQLLQGYFSDDVNAIAYVERPLDLKAALDGVIRQAATDPAWQGKLNVEQVGVLGNSMGAQTALTMAGAPINTTRLQQVCTGAPTLNFSVLLQCIAKDLPARTYPTTDPRIKAVSAVHPLASVIFGPESMAAIQVPTLIMAGSADIMAPATPEQIYPFTWLTTPTRYLALMEPSGHIFEEKTDDLDPRLGHLLGGPDPERKQAMVKALNVAFFQVHLNNRPEFARYFSPAATAALGADSPLALTVVRSLTAQQIEAAYGGPPPLPVVPPLE